MDKWLMFKNYMHNELGITKEEIRQWIHDAVNEQAERLVNNEFGKFDVKKVVADIISEEQYFGSRTLKRDISQELSKQILEQLHFNKK